MTSVQQTLTGSTVSYTYDALGRRIMRTDPQGSKLRYWYDGLGILMTKEKPSGSGSWRTKQVYTLKQAALGHIISERTNTAWNAQGTATAWGDKWFHFDLLGNTTGEIGPGGSVATQVDMEAFGTVLSGGQNGYRLTTKQYDPDAGLYYFNARWYQYEIVRLLERDPVPHGNLYTYCRNNPLRYFDPTGMIAIFSPSRWSLPMNLLCLYSVRRAFEKDFIEDDIREAYINDFYLHCVAACEMRKQCGWLGGFQLEGLGTAREKYLDRWSDGAGHVLGDAQANIDGIHCGSRCKNEDCSDCCADRMGYTAEHPSRRRGRTPFF
jgi:RHS repeat-associated protein